MDNTRIVEFTSDNGDMLDVTFFTTIGMAQVKYKGVDYLLRQYPTASGYGYKNPFIDIRGKGKNLILSMQGDNKSIEFAEK